MKTNLKMVHLFNILLIYLLMKEGNCSDTEPRQNELTSNQILQKRNLTFDQNGRVMMGVPNDNCDNGFDNLSTDWDGSPVNYTCYNPKNPISVDPSIPPVLECEKIPANFIPFHQCMNQNITYNSVLPTHNDHRPIWPVYGEYQFVPPQRWLHNVEHGGVILLYHPCANPFVVQKIKWILKSCLRRHVITKSNRLPVKMPIALVAWGCRYLINDASTEEIVNFIKKHAKKGPEQLSADGIYNLTLIEKSKIPPGSDFEDTILCPGH